MNYLKIFFVLVAFIFVACEKQEKEENVAGEKIEVYLLEDYLTIRNSMQIDEHSANISEKALITYDDIIAYNPSTYSFKVNSNIANMLKDQDGFGYHTKAFAVTIDREIIYTGYFWSALSSSSCDWVVIDPVLSSYAKELKVNLAYPTNEFRSSDIDKRNDVRLLGIFKRDSKLN